MTEQRKGRLQWGAIILLLVVVAGLVVSKVWLDHPDRRSTSQQVVVMVTNDDAARLAADAVAAQDPEALDRALAVVDQEACAVEDE